jgi:PilZ domain
MHQDRRRVLRFHFTAPAEFVDESSGTRIHAQVTDISLNGCSLEVGERLATGTPGHVKISTKRDSFESPAVVAYIGPNREVGVIFHDIDPRSAQVLQNWLVAAMQGNVEPQE